MVLKTAASGHNTDLATLVSRNAAVLNRSAAVQNFDTKRLNAEHQKVQKALVLKQIDVMRYEFEKALQGERATRGTKSLFSQFDLISKIMQNMG